MNKEEIRTFFILTNKNSFDKKKTQTKSIYLKVMLSSGEVVMSCFIERFFNFIDEVMRLETMIQYWAKIRLKQIQRLDQLKNIQDNFSLWISLFWNNFSNNVKWALKWYFQWVERRTFRFLFHLILSFGVSTDVYGQEEDKFVKIAENCVKCKTIKSHQRKCSVKTCKNNCWISVCRPSLLIKSIIIVAFWPSCAKHLRSMWFFSSLPRLLLFTVKKCIVN